MNQLLIAIALVGCLVNISYAGIDEEFGGKSSWWTPNYNKFLSYLGLEKSYALVVGVGDYKDDVLASLPSENDAIRIKDYLINEAGFDHVRLVTGDKVTRERIHDLMNSFYLPTVTERDRFLFYWSGHGVTSGESNRRLGYLAVNNSKVNSPASMLSMRNVRDWDSQLKAKQTLYLLDACFSGIAASQAMSPVQEQTIDRVNQPSRQVLTAGLENQQTIAINDLGGGVFTRAILDGLQGRADISTGNFRKDGVVTARELEVYIRKRVDHERLRVGWQSPITPVLYNFKNYSGDFFFVSDKRELSKGALIQSRVTTPAAGVVATGIILDNTAFIKKMNPISKKRAEKASPSDTSKKIKLFISESKKNPSCKSNFNNSYYIKDASVKKFLSVNYGSNKTSAILTNGSSVHIWGSDISLLSECVNPEDWPTISGWVPAHETVLARGANCTFSKPKSKYKRNFQIYYKTRGGVISNTGGEFYPSDIKMGYYKNAAEYSKSKVTNRSFTGIGLVDVNTAESGCWNIELNYCGDGIIQNQYEECDFELDNSSCSTACKRL